MLLANNILGMGGIEYLESNDWFSSVSVTPTNLILKLRANDVRLVVVSADIAYQAELPGPAFRLSERGEELVLTPEQETSITDGRHHSLIFSPVSFKTKGKGFRVIAENNARSFGHGITTTTAAYVVLSDTPTEAGEEDVEMVMVDGAWKGKDFAELDMRNRELRLRGEGLMPQTNEAREKGYNLREQAARQRAELRGRHIESGEQSTNVMVSPPVAPPEVKPPRFWLYALVALALCLCGGVHLFRKKRR